MSFFLGLFWEISIVKPVQDVIGKKVQSRRHKVQGTSQESRHKVQAKLQGTRQANKEKRFKGISYL
jgi:hypothetical protein